MSVLILIFNIVFPLRLFCNTFDPILCFFFASKPIVKMRSVTPVSKYRPYSFNPYQLHCFLVFHLSPSFPVSRSFILPGASPPDIYNYSILLFICQYFFSIIFYLFSLFSKQPRHCVRFRFWYTLLLFAVSTPKTAFSYLSAGFRLCVYFRNNPISQ